MSKRTCVVWGRLLAALVLVCATLAMPRPAWAQEAREVVRVGWFESPFNTLDASGRRGGFGYEYQLKVAAHTGWAYTYVNGSFVELLEKLEKGEIDLLSDVSFTGERAEHMLFSERAMGTENYTLFVAPGTTDISARDPDSLAGKRVGALKGSAEVAQFEHWAAQHGVEAEVVELACSDAEAIGMLTAGKLDAYVTLSSLDDDYPLKPICKVGQSDIYFAVSSRRADLLAELDEAMAEIQEESPSFSLRLYEEHLQHLGSATYLTDRESAWLEEHGPIRVGYQDDFLPLCGHDPETGELSGVLADYLDYAQDCITNAHLAFEPVAYPTARAAFEALESGEVDCVFPANLAPYDAERLGVSCTPALLETGVFAVVRESDKDVFAGKEHVIVALDEGNPNYLAYLDRLYPSWRKVTYADTESCLRAVAERTADCVLISSYRYNSVSRMCRRLGLEPLSTGSGLEFSLATRTGDTELHTILSKAAGQVPNSAFNAALSRNITTSDTATLADVVWDNLPVVLALSCACALTILVLLVRSRRSERRAQELIRATETDELTGLYTRTYFVAYARRLVGDGTDGHDAVVCDIEHFHAINAYSGYDVGDRILRILATEVAAVAAETGGIAGRYGADRFSLLLASTDDYDALLGRLQRKVAALARATHVRLHMGVAHGRADLSAQQLFDQANEACNMARGRAEAHLIVFDDELRARELAEQRLMNDLAGSLANYEFEVYYQPKYDITQERARLAGAEALVRWNHPELGMIAPERFIPLLEGNGMIRELDRFVWDQAARQIARWRAQFGFALPVSVNLSRVDVFDPTLQETLAEICMQNGLEPSALELELTETSYTEDADRVVEVVGLLREAGHRVAMDDFGCGYSSLGMLSELPVDAIKLDRSFVADIEVSERDAHLVALVAQVGRDLGVPVVAEGAETAQQVELLRELGCTIVQGYYFSRPLHPTDFESVLREARDGAAREHS